MAGSFRGVARSFLRNVGAVSQAQKACYAAALPAPNRNPDVKYNKVRDAGKERLCLRFASLFSPASLRISYFTPRVIQYYSRMRYPQAGPKSPENFVIFYLIFMFIK